jgi:hypothetical protein
MYMIPINLWSVVVNHRLMGLKNESSYSLGRGRTVVAAISSYATSAMAMDWVTLKVSAMARGTA